MSSSTMPDYPLEIWQRIFALACTDGGKTGCSLSLVSQYVRKASEPYRYQTVLLEGATQTSTFLELLQAQKGDSDRRKNVKLQHLFLSDVPAGGIQANLREFPFSLASPEWNERLYNILSRVSGSLITLTIYMHQGLPSLLPPTSLNKLEELSVYGDYPNEKPSIASPVFPKLSKFSLQGRRLRSFRGITGDMTEDLLQRLSQGVPNLTELSMPTDLTFDWRYALGHGESTAQASSKRLATLLPHVRKIVVYPVTRDIWHAAPHVYMYQQQRDELARHGAQNPEIHFEVFEAPPPDETSVKYAWLDTCMERVSARVL